MNKEISLEELKNVAASLPPLTEKEVDSMLPSSELLAPEFYLSLMENYLEYMKDLHNISSITK